MGKHLDFYYKCLEEGKMPNDGLCNCALMERIDDELLNLFEPTSRNNSQLVKRNKSTVYWASDVSQESDTSLRYYGFSPLRQTIVLFMAAMNNEL